MADMEKASALKNQHIYKVILEQIKNGTLSPGDRLPAERELTELYGASRVTVRESLRKLEEMHMLERRRGSGTFVAGRVPAKTELRKIGLVFVSGLEDYEDPYTSQILLGAYRNSEPGSLAVVPVKMESREKLSEYIRSMDSSGRNLDGFVFICQLEDDEIEILEDAGVCFVSLMPPGGSREISYVDIDNAGGVYMLTSFLLSLKGGRAPLVLCGPLDLKVNRDKVSGFRKALAEFGIAFSEDMVFTSDNRSKEPARSFIGELARKRAKHPFDTLVVFGDWATIGAVEALRANSLKAGEDVAIGTYGGYSWMYKVLELEFPSVSLPYSEQMEAALRILLKRIENPESPAVVEKISPRLLIKGLVGKQEGVF